MKWLFDNHWIPPNGAGWVDYIRDRGNDATHEIMAADPELAKRLVDLLGLLLRFAYEMRPPDEVEPDATD